MCFQLQSRFDQFSDLAVGKRCATFPLVHLSTFALPHLTVDERKWFLTADQVQIGYRGAVNNPPGNARGSIDPHNGTVLFPGIA